MIETKRFINEFTVLVRDSTSPVSGSSVETKKGKKNMWCNVGSRLSKREGGFI